MKIKGFTGKELLKRSQDKMTVERLRTYPGYENISDGEGENVIQTLETLARIVVKTAPAIFERQEGNAAKLKENRCFHS